MVSTPASMGRKTKETGSFELTDDLNDYVAEGVEAMVPYRGSVTDIIIQITEEFVQDLAIVVVITYNKCRIMQNL